jgi:hypothetical protein
MGCMSGMRNGTGIGGLVGTVGMVGLVGLGIVGFVVGASVGDGVGSFESGDGAVN